MLSGMRIHIHLKNIRHGSEKISQFGSTFFAKGMIFRLFKESASFIVVNYIANIFHMALVVALVNRNGKDGLKILDCVSRTLLSAIGSVQDSKFRLFQCFEIYLCFYACGIEKGNVPIS